MRVIHFSLSKLAGAPFLIVDALRRHTNIDARLVDYRRWGVFPHDLVAGEDDELILSLLESVDIIHLHNDLHLDSLEFLPINFRALEKKGVRFVRHFHSVPRSIAAGTGGGVQSLLADPTPSVVIGQYPEPFYPRARVVPNLVPTDDPRYRSTRTGAADEFDFVFSPSNRQSAWEARWGTKGAPETVRLLRDFHRRSGARVRVLNGRPLAEVMDVKRRSRIVIDELVTGSYHLSGLEGLSLGKPVFSFLDGRIERLMRFLSGAQNVPFINVRLEDSVPLMEQLYRDHALSEEIGNMSREWMSTYWSEAAMVNHFRQLYDDLIVDPARVTKQAELRLDTAADLFFAVTVPDAVYHQRLRRLVRWLSHWKRPLLPPVVEKRLKKARWKHLTRSFR